MGKRNRRNYDEHFKTKVVLEALKEQKTLAQLSSEYSVQASQITTWKKQALSNSGDCRFPSLFGSEKKTEIPKEVEEEITAPLYQQIGQLKVENEFLKKKLKSNY
jgi:transposase